MSIITNLVSLKEKILNVTYNQDLDEFDTEQIDYIISLIDYFVIGTIQVNEENLSILTEELVNSSIYQNNPRILSCLHNIIKLQKDLRNGKV